MMKTDEWQSMETAPRDGTKFDVKCISSKEGGSVEVIVEEVIYAFKPMRTDDTMILWGKQNILSPYLTAIAWRPRT